MSIDLAKAKAIFLLAAEHASEERQSFLAEACGDDAGQRQHAMAHWQVYEKDKAREWYNRAAQWVDKNQLHLE